MRREEGRPCQWEEGGDSGKSRWEGEVTESLRGLGRRREAGPDGVQDADDVKDEHERVRGGEERPAMTDEDDSDVSSPGLRPGRARRRREGRRKKKTPGESYTTKKTKSLSYLIKVSARRVATPWERGGGGKFFN